MESPIVYESYWDSYRREGYAYRTPTGWKDSAYSSVNSKSTFCPVRRPGLAHRPTGASASREQRQPAREGRRPAGRAGDCAGTGMGGSSPFHDTFAHPPHHVAGRGTGRGKAETALRKRATLCTPRSAG